jgi:hypothetical protein
MERKCIEKERVWRVKFEVVVSVKTMNIKNPY